MQKRGTQDRNDCHTTTCYKPTFVHEKYFVRAQYCVKVGWKLKFSYKICSCWHRRESVALCVYTRMCDEAVVGARALRRLYTNRINKGRRKQGKKKQGRRKKERRLDRVVKQEMRKSSPPAQKKAESYFGCDAMTKLHLGK